MRTLRLALGLDAVLIGVHVALGLMVMRGAVGHWPDLLNITRDWGAGEIFNYVKWALILVALIGHIRRSRDPGAAGLALLFALALLDDALQLHERGATALIEGLALYRFLDLETSVILGEFAVWAALGMIALAGLVAGWAHVDPRRRERMIPALLIFGAVLICAVVIDALHGLAADRSLRAGLIGIAEDGGEMVFLSLLLAYIRGTYAPRAIAAGP
ncbi:hypothetical protein [Marivita sp. GX14005]|uniref:hypothetical protein n=1 Tax=Marivita sp. GX14005 TaxID=2942276 RepID=UPI0020187181|nr:hypothetical protein [Marivita sp. GX14005]MCL3883244.1 hypothetical protein [Marivita sp. GX14005]